MPPILRIDRAPLMPWRRLFCALVVLLSIVGAPRPAADEIPVTSASLRVENGEVLLTADFNVSLTPALEQALDKGVPLYFTIEFELLRTRPFWFPDKVAQWSITYRVSYSSLTRQYRVASGPLGQTFESLDDVERFIGRVASRPVAQASDLPREASYEGAVRMKLDVNQLPKPFQVNALASREWQLASDWQRFAFTP
ncbi:MAG TPA: DUF4390 domain-containing protein [Casimicrobiaceae bacterium]|nr:DUF4390 domain-containing protein [Casimicrobiaceae bacterium]